MNCTHDVLMLTHWRWWKSWRGCWNLIGDESEQGSLDTTNTKESNVQLEKATPVPHFTTRDDFTRRGLG